jgi:hypothetical protein
VRTRTYSWAAGLILCALAPLTVRAVTNEIQIAATLPYGQNPNEKGPLVYLYSFLPGSGVSAGGLALDLINNVYISDNGITNNAGSIIMVPADGGPQVVIMRGLDRPSDIEVLSDQRGLLIAEPDGRVVVRYFGISIQPQPANHNMRGDAVATILTDAGPVSARLSPDGYFHFPGALSPQQQSTTFHAYIRNGIIEFPVFNIQINNVGGVILGHTVVRVAF